jgi:hypothetical protein
MGKMVMYAAPGEAIMLQNVLKITSAIDTKPLNKLVIGLNRM